MRNCADMLENKGENKYQNSLDACRLTIEPPPGYWYAWWYGYFNAITPCFQGFYDGLN
jgi:hypothetical protein